MRRFGAGAAGGHGAAPQVRHRRRAVDRVAEEAEVVVLRRCRRRRRSARSRRSRARRSASAAATVRRTTGGPRPRPGSSAGWCAPSRSIRPREERRPRRASRRGPLAGIVATMRHAPSFPDGAAVMGGAVERVEHALLRFSRGERGRGCESLTSARRRRASELGFDLQVRRNGPEPDDERQPPNRRFHAPAPRAAGNRAPAGSPDLDAERFELRPLVPASAALASIAVR